MEELKTTQSISNINNLQLEPIISKFYHWEKTTPDKTYLRQPYGNTWKEYSWKEVGQQARKMATALIEMGYDGNTPIGIISKNCAHWLIADLAITMSNNYSVPFYPNLTAHQLEHVLEHSGTKVLFVGKLDTWDEMREGVPGDVKCIALPDSPASEFVSWDEVIQDKEPLQGEPTPDINAISTVIYTSGTTGRPKGVVVQHLAQATAIKGVEEILPLEKIGKRYFSYLPLCHVAERGIIQAWGLYSGGMVSFVESLDTFMQNLQDTQPTIFFAVPRIWSKFQLGVLEKMPQKRLDILLKIPILSDFIKKKIKTGLGLNEAEMVFTAAAPTPKSLHKWFNKLDLKLQELYGMTENVGACTIMRKHAYKPGTVGQPYPGVDLKIDENSGEILMKADWIMQGYFREPEMTADVIRNGYLHTGDMGEIDEEGHLKITGRVKDMFKTAKGEYVVPGPMEWKFAADSFVEQVCVMGSGLPQPIALVILSAIGKNASREAVEHSLATMLTLINAEQVNYERIKKIVVLKDEWSIENGILTPTLKIKRNLIDNRYLEEAEKWYDQEDTILWA
ncbi:MAG: AMP-dependent synthetase [Thalassobius sp.]|nr:AMP-dependent synthetase [Thalassovita sp.]